MSSNKRKRNTKRIIARCRSAQWPDQTTRAAPNTPTSPKPENHPPHTPNATPSEPWTANHSSITQSLNPHSHLPQTPRVYTTASPSSCLSAEFNSTVKTIVISSLA
ncbi:hypothetical protein BKA80DRAFT_83591 [Phyllosticta citrichinensis]